MWHKVANSFEGSLHQLLLKPNYVSYAFLQGFCAVDIGILPQRSFG
jgi:hypothetical protein